MTVLAQIFFFLDYNFRIKWNVACLPEQHYVTITKLEALESDRPLCSAFFFFHWLFKGIISSGKWFNFSKLWFLCLLYGPLCVISLRAQCLRQNRYLISGIFIIIIFIVINCREHIFILVKIYQCWYTYTKSWIHCTNVMKSLTLWYLTTDSFQAPPFPISLLPYVWEYW